jgi:hypothetical protein
MKIFFLLLPLVLFGQAKRFVGKYNNNFGEQMILNADNSFNYSWGVDTGHGWANGHWYTKNDTIYFKVVPIYDTVRVVGNKKDTLLLSQNNVPERIEVTEEDFKYWDLYNLFGQNSSIVSKLFYRDDKLFEIDEKGKLITQKKYFWWTSKYLDPWYGKEN